MGEPFPVSIPAEGRPLREHLIGLELRRALAWVQELAQELAQAHAGGAVHGDVCPANVWIDAGGHAHLVRPAAAVGAPRYASPEQASGGRVQVGPASDQFSLGVTMYELMTGQHPFASYGTERMLKAIREEDPRPPRAIDPTLPADAETVCLKALEKDPARRYATMGDLAADLGRHLAGIAVQGRVVSSATRVRRRIKRGWKNAVLTVVGILVTGGAIALAIWSHMPPPDAEREVQRARETERRARDAGPEEKRALLVQALTDYQAALTDDPESAEARRGVDRMQAAIEAYDVERAKAEKRIGHAQAKIEAAERYRHQADPTTTRLVQLVTPVHESLKEVILTVPDRADGQYLYGRTFELAGERDGAEARYADAVRLDPQLGDAHERLGLLLLHKAYGAGSASQKGGARAPVAESLVDRAVSELGFAAGATNWMAPSQIAATRAIAKDLAAWVRAVRAGKAPPDMPSDGLPPTDSLDEERLWLGALAMEPTKALRFIDQALALRPLFADAWLLRGMILRQRGDLGPAQAALEKAKAMEDGWSDPCVELGRMALDRGDPDAAIKCCGFRPGAEALYVHGSALLALGKTWDAVQRLQDALTAALPDWRNRADATQALRKAQAQQRR